MAPLSRFDTGATLKRALENKFCGDRLGWIRDWFGHIWYIASLIANLTGQGLRVSSQFA